MVREHGGERQQAEEREPATRDVAEYERTAGAEEDRDERRRPEGEQVWRWVRHQPPPPTRAVDQQEAEHENEQSRDCVSLAVAHGRRACATSVMRPSLTSP